MTRVFEDDVFVQSERAPSDARRNETIQPMGARIASDMRCVHCHTTETPLWRAGPAGPKTLCNACGVRWKKTGSLVARAKRTATDVAPLRKRARTAERVAAPLPPPPPPLVAPRPVSVFRPADAARARYDSIFSGLMVVHRASDPLRAPSRQLPCPSPPPLQEREAEFEPIFVTEVHAPSPSPSPPPMPTVKRSSQGSGFKLCLTVVNNDQTNPASAPAASTSL